MREPSTHEKFNAASNYVGSKFFFFRSRFSSFFLSNIAVTRYSGIILKGRFTFCKISLGIPTEIRRKDGGKFISLSKNILPILNLYGCFEYWKINS